jgi:hypothetical protein
MLASKIDRRGSFFPRWRACAELNENTYLMVNGEFWDISCFGLDNGRTGLMTLLFKILFREPRVTYVVKFNFTKDSDNHIV